MLVEKDGELQQMRDWLTGLEVKVTHCLFLYNFVDVSVYSLMSACFHGPYSIIYLYCTVFMLEYVTTSSCNVNSALSCGLRCPFSHYHGLSDTADSQNTKISYHFIPPVLYFVFYKWGQSVMGFSSVSVTLTPTEGPIVLVFQPNEVLERPYYTSTQIR